MSFKSVEPYSKQQSSLVPEGVSYSLGHPSEVIEHPTMSKSAKRALLASWASDQNAVEHAPGFRQLESGAIVRLDEILSALKSLDDPEPSRGSPPAFARRPSFRLIRGRAPMRANRRPDDDPPPPKPIRVRLTAAA
jgi:hypothetical protein